MESKFVVEKTTDFLTVIEEVMTWYKNNKKGTGLVLALAGDLGAGKTAFAQELAKYLGVTELVTSPTFTIMKQYAAEHDLFDRIYHIDAYRIESESEVVPLQLEQLLKEERVVVCIEWPEQVSTIIPATAVSITIEIMTDEKRLVGVKYPD